MADERQKKDPPKSQWLQRFGVRQIIAIRGYYEGPHSHQGLLNKVLLQSRSKITRYTDGYYNDNKNTSPCLLVKSLSSSYMALFAWLVLVNAKQCSLILAAAPVVMIYMSETMAWSWYEHHITTIPCTANWIPSYTPKPGAEIHQSSLSLWWAMGICLVTAFCFIRGYVSSMKLAE